MSDSTIHIEVDGQKLEAKPGQMLIEVTDAAGISVPRFCYHNKLSIAANCRMCLVEVEKVPKPLPACATPVSDGMKVFTKSPAALAAQKGTMEFLLINHPLDCPICDQGGECELQDVAMGYGKDVSRYVEGKRVVTDPDLGPLVATDMTRCIHCTRCVRFSAEIAGVRELGATGRGEHMKIGTYVQSTVDSELSGNIIDLCPVGALTSKPFRFHARAWELNERPGVAAHDGLGSNVFCHVRRDELLRVVPRDNEAINECWISDRDRFSYEGLNTLDRLTAPLIRKNGRWEPIEWADALAAAAEMLKSTGGELATLVSPSATLEEMYLAQKLTRALGSNSVDHRLRQTDFRHPAADPALPWLGQSLSEVEQNQAVLLVGSNPRKEQPILGHRLRKAALEGAAVMALNPLRYDFNYPLAAEQVVAPSAMLGELAAVAKAAGASLGAALQGVAASASDATEVMAERLKAADKALVLLGSSALSHPDYTLLREVASALAEATGAQLGLVGEGANSTGAWLCGCVPHRDATGASVSGGLSAGEALAEAQRGYLLLNLEPDCDLADPAQAMQSLERGRVVALSSYRSESLERCADLLLPVGAFAETSGTLVNLQGDRQSFAGVVAPPGEARPAWKVLRVLGNLVNAEGFDYVSSEEVRDEALAAAGERGPDNRLPAAADGAPALSSCETQRIGDLPMYAVDAVVRRARPLQHTADTWRRGVRVAPELAASLAAEEGASVRITQGERDVVLPLTIDARVPAGCVWLPMAVTGSEQLGAPFGALAIEKV